MFIFFMSGFRSFSNIFSLINLVLIYLTNYVFLKQVNMEFHIDSFFEYLIGLYH